MTRHLSLFFASTALWLVVLGGVMLGCDSTEDAGTPPTPLLVTPENGGAEQPNAVELQWARCDGADGYHVQVSASPQFTETYLDAPRVSGTYQDVRDLRLHVPYYWRVRAFNTAGFSAWSPVATFTPTVAAERPAVPRPIFPADSARSMPINVTFAWEPSARATRYQIQVSQETVFIRNDADMPGVHATSQQIIDLVPTYTYFWRVRAENPVGVSAWSPIRTFVVLD